MSTTRLEHSGEAQLAALRIASLLTLPTLLGALEEGISPRVTCPELKAYLRLDDYVTAEVSRGLRSLTNQHHLQAAYLRRACHFH